MSLTSLSISSSEQNYEQKKQEYISQVTRQKKGSYSVSHYYGEGAKVLEQLTCNMYKSPVEVYGGIPWQCKVKYSLTGSNIEKTWQEIGDHEVIFQLPESNLMQETDFKERFFVSDLVVTNSFYLTGRSFDVYNSTGGVFRLNTDRKLFVSENVVPSYVKRYNPALLGQRYANQLGYSPQQESLIVFTEENKIYQPTDVGAQILLAYCGGTTKTIVTEEKIIRANLGFFYKIEYSAFETNRVNYT